MSALQIKNTCESDPHSHANSNLHLTCFQQGFIAQSVEHRTSIMDVMGSNPVGTSDFFLGFIGNCLSYFITARITFTCNKNKRIIIIIIIRLLTNVYHCII